MPTMLMPAITSYFAIYRLEGDAAARSLNWDLHATAMDKHLAISHARMLALQPGVREVQVKEVREDTTRGTISVRNIKSCKAGHYFGVEARTALIALCVGALGLMSLFL